MLVWSWIVSDNLANTFACLESLYWSCLLVGWRTKKALLHFFVWKSCEAPLMIIGFCRWCCRRCWCCCAVHDLNVRSKSCFLSFSWRKCGAQTLDDAYCLLYFASDLRRCVDVVGILYDLYVRNRRASHFFLLWKNLPCAAWWWLSGFAGDIGGVVDTVEPDKNWTKGVCP